MSDEKKTGGGSTRSPLAEDSGRALPTSKIVIPMPRVTPPKPSPNPVPPKK